ncbi:hypothetical protein HK102_000318 [Quaeritorhiza haematococci]|nr:hypothetical protein HK102_000318 [Quaeritorhiza haematococci]
MMSGELAQGIAIIFMDLMLPVMDGREAARCIRELGITVPIVASSIAVSPGDKAKLDLSEFGITDVLAKPFGKAELLQILLQHNIEVKETFATSTETSPRNSIAGRDNVVAVDGQVLGQTLIDLTESATRKGGRNESKGIDESGSKSNSKYSPSISKTQVLVVQSKSKGKECLCEVLESFDSVVVQQAETIVDACRLLDSSAQHINNKDDPSTESTFTINTNELKIVFLCSDLPESWVEAADEFRRKGFGGAIILALPMEEDAFLSKDDIAKVNDVVRAPPTIKQVEDLFAKWGISVSAARSSIAESSFSYPQDLAPAILIIDDSSIFRTILRRMLEGICVSISIHEACDGREALDKLSSTRFSLVFMDADLFLVDHINNTYPEVHIVVISSYDLSPDTLESLCGKRVHQIWEKPVSRQQVLNVIQYFNITHVTPAGTLGRTVSSSEKQLGSPSRTSMNKKVVFEDELPAPPPPVNRRKVPETSKGRRRHSVCIGEDMAKLIESAVVQEEYTEKEPPSEGAIFGCTSEQTCVDNNKTPSISNSHPPCPTRRTTSLPRSVSSVRRIFGGGKILIVEESLVERKTMARLFYEESPDLEVVEADRVADALRLCLKNQYNLIVINLETRGMKGEEVAARIRNMGVNCPIFAVADKFSLNAYAWPLKHAGILDVFTKPLSRLEVAKMLLHTSNNPSSSTRVDSNPGHGRRMSTPAALQDIENFKSMRRSRSNQATQLATEFV